MSELDPAALRALEALKADEPTAGDFERIASKLEPRLVSAGPTAMTMTPKLWALGGATTVLVVATIFALSRPAPPPVIIAPVPTVPELAPVNEVKVEIAPAVVAPVSPLQKKKRAAVVTETKTHEPEPETTATPPPPEPVDPADEELRILLEARRALTAHHPEKTLTLLESIESTKATALAPERAATKALALCALGRFDEAERGLENLGAAYAATVRQACDAAKR